MNSVQASTDSVGRAEPSGRANARPVPARAAALKNGQSVDVSVYIERLVIDGVPLTGVQGACLQEGLQQELARLLEGNGISPHWTGGAVRSVSAPPIHLSTGGEELGRRIARSVFASLNQESDT